jgi:predicted secreted protein
MLKWLLFAVIPILIIGLLIGCGEKEETEQKYGFLPVNKIEVKVNEEFSISRPYDLTSGYIWREKYDESMLELLENKVDYEEKESGEILLFQVFNFKAKKKGNTQIFLAHTRAEMGGNVVRAQEVFDVYIK